MTKQASRQKFGSVDPFTSTRSNHTVSKPRENHTPHETPADFHKRQAALEKATWRPGPRFTVEIFQNHFIIRDRTSRGTGAAGYNPSQKVPWNLTHPDGHAVVSLMPSEIPAPRGRGEIASYQSGCFGRGFGSVKSILKWMLEHDRDDMNELFELTSNTYDRFIAVKLFETLIDICRE